MKTKEETIEELERRLLHVELEYQITVDALENAIDYVNSSQDLRAEMNDQFNDTKTRK